MTRREAASLAADALKLRRWALRLFSWPGDTRTAVGYAGDAPHKDATANRRNDASSGSSGLPPFPPSIPPRAWELFLRAEHCALPLRRRLAALSLEGQLPADAPNVIATLAREEMQRVLSARAQLKRLSQWAMSAGTEIVVLKGAVAAIDDSIAVDLSDIDLWIEPGTDEAALLDWLSGSGHVPRPHAAQHHHASRLTHQLVSVEVHHEVPYANLESDWPLRTQPLAGTFPGLKRLDAADNLVHLLMHSTMQHIERRGRIRDVLLMAHARSFCTESDLRMVHDRAASHESADALVPMLAMSAAIGSGHKTDDAFVCVAAGRYLDTASGPHHAATRFLHSSVATTAVLYGVRGCSHQFEKIFRTRSAASPVPILRWLQRRSPRIGSGLVLNLRLMKRGLALLFAVPRAYTARRIANAAKSA